MEVTVPPLFRKEAPSPMMWGVGVIVALAETGAVSVSVAVAGNVGAPVLEVLGLELAAVPAGVAVVIAEGEGEAEMHPDPLLVPPKGSTPGVSVAAIGECDWPGVEVPPPTPPLVAVGYSNGVGVVASVGSPGRETQGDVHPLLELVRVEMSVGLPLSLPVEQEEGERDGVGAPLTVAVPLMPPDLLAREVGLGVVEG